MNSCVTRPGLDAEHWKSLRAFPGALADEDITKRLFHIHLVQAAYLSIINGRTFDRKSFMENRAMEKLAVTAEQNSTAFELFLSHVTPDALETVVNIPWLKDPPALQHVSRVIVQATMHSHYHRGQNARRLRELGGEPPMTDFIGWKWKGEPKPEWPR